MLLRANSHFTEKVIQHNLNVPINNGRSDYTEGADLQAPVMSFYRPRGSLARALYQKQKADDFLSLFDKNESNAKV
ncbi:hypothetical protein QE152_g30730 [Popillia japonica]|uniref:Uncharacterized protein n=1 Tax=Popillia japonica TaxID=7064 RepID=A0AAW1JCY0_POPJA